jgi:prepilin-type processing-associated H-X9-DG protein
MMNRGGSLESDLALAAMTGPPALRYSGAWYGISYDQLQHGNLFNVVAIDGHVMAIPIVELFDPTNTARYWNIDHQLHPELWVPQ